MILLFYGLMFVALGVWGIYLWMKWRELPDFSNAVYNSMKEKGLLSDRIEREAFTAAFKRAEAPVAATYRWFAALVSLLALPPLISAFNFFWDTVWRWNGAVEGPFESGYMLHLFMTFVVVMGVVVGFLYVVTAHYYRNAPPSLKSEIRRLEKEKA